MQREPIKFCMLQLILRGKFKAFNTYNLRKSQINYLSFYLKKLKKIKRILNLKQQGSTKNKYKN